MIYQFDDFRIFNSIFILALTEKDTYINVNINFKNRGMLLESIINKTIKYYASNNIALFEKKSLPIQIKKVTTKNKSHLVEAKIHNKSTIDYYGVFKGTYIAFEAKSTIQDSLLLSNIKEHQIDYLQKVAAHGGLAFLIIGFMSRNEFYFVPINKISSQKKTLNLEEVKKLSYVLELTYPGHLDFISIIDKML